MAPKRPFILVALPLILALLLAPGGVAPITADEPQPPPPLQYRTHSAPAAILSNRTTLQQSQNIELVGQIGGSTYAVAVQGNHAYIGLGPRLVVLDVSDPARPAVVGESAPLPGVVQGVAMAGNYAYVAAGSSGLRIIDVSNATSPREVGYYVTAGDAYGVALAGDRAYVADGSGLRIIDVSNATSPREVGYYDTAGYAYGVALASNYAYVAAGSSGLWILRFTAPLTPLTYPVYLPLIQLDR